MPVLSSPELAVQQARDVMARLNGEAPEACRRRTARRRSR